MESFKCPITQELFEDPVMGDDGHTYERKAITDWLTKNGTSPITRQLMNVTSLRTNYMARKMIDELKARSPINERDTPNGIVHIPCEICKEPVGLPNWSNHTQNCREREAHRLAMRARSMSQEPVTEQLPCEYCHELYPANRLHSHQKKCTNNPVNRVSVVEVARSRPSQFQLPTKRSDNINRNDPPSSNARSSQNLCLAQYQSIDIDRTHAANRQRDNTESLSHLDNSPRAARRYDNIAVRRNDHRPNENMSPANNQGGRRPVPPRPRSPNAASSRLRSSLDDLQDIREDHNSNNAGVVYRPSHPNGSKYQQRRYDVPGRFIVISNRPGRLTMKKNKEKSCGPVSEPIPAHPDAIYRPQNRPVPAHVPPVASEPIIPRVMSSNSVVAAPLAASGGGFSPWWIIGPLIALLAAMALAALAYAMKKKHDQTKQAEGENDPNKAGNKDGKTGDNKKEVLEGEHGSARKSPVENVPLRSIKPNTTSDEQKKAVPMSTTAKGNSTSDTRPLLPNNIKKEANNTAAVPIHGLTLTNDRSALPSAHSPTRSPHQVMPINVTRMTKPDSDASKKTDDKNTSKTTHTNPIDSLLVSPLKNIRSVLTHKTGSNYTESLQPISTVNPTSSTGLSTQKLGPVNDELDLNATKSKSNGNVNSKENEQKSKAPANDTRNVHDGKPSTDIQAGASNSPSSTNVDRKEQTDSSRVGQDEKDFTAPSSRSEMYDQNATNKPDVDRLNEPNSPEQHGIGKSPFILNMPSGTKQRKEKQKPQNRNDQTAKGNVSTKSLSSNPNLQKQTSPNESIHSNRSKNPYSSSDIPNDKQQSTLTVHSKRHPLQESSETISSSSIASAEPTDEKKFKFISSAEKSSKNTVQPSDQYSMINKTDLDKFGSRHIQSDSRSQASTNPSNREKSKNPNDDKSDESTTSSTHSGIPNHNKTMSLMPNVPQCKTNASSNDDDDYDEFFPVSANSSKRHKTNKPNSNLNINASIIRKKRPLLTHRSLTKRFHHQEKKSHSNTSDNQ